MNLERIAFLGAAALVLLVTVVIILVMRWRHERASKLARERAIEERAHLPASLHPVIDTNICIGSLSCVTACPEGDILGVIDGAAALIEGANCIGHGRCAAECPVGAIKLVFGTAERGVDLPEVDASFESSRDGVHIVGELGGMGLIKNAITQGVQVAQALAERIGKSGGNGLTDVAIIGAGPAGLATAVAVREAGLSFRIFDQNRFGGTIAQYPRQKVVMTEQVRLPLVGRFGKPYMSKEQLLEAWTKACDRAQVEVEEGVKLESLEGNDGAFTLVTSKGTVQARKVVLATGRRGTPRKLGVPGEDLTKVTSALDDPTQYAGMKVLVVGGGDSAIEAARALSEVPGTDVSISYRNERFGKSRRENQERIASLIQLGKVRALMASEVVAVEEKSVRLKHGGRELRLENDYVIACLGGELPTDFLKKVGIALKRHHGERRGTVTNIRAKGLTERRTRARWLVPLLWGLGLSIIAYLAYRGYDFYLLRGLARRRSPLREMYGPAGLWGHGVGIVATLFMLSNFLYAVRKRLRVLKRISTIQTWLTWHMFVGLMSPVVIAFHAAFQWKNEIANITFISLMLVVGAGVIGRFIYGLVPRLFGVEASDAMLEARWERDRKSLADLLGAAAQQPRGYALLKEVQDAKARSTSLPGLILRMPFEWTRGRIMVSRARSLVPRPTYKRLRNLFTEMLRLRGQMAFNKKLQGLLSAWRIFHVSLSVLLVFVIAAHITVAIYVGYHWIWK